MNARNYRVGVYPTPLDFPQINGLAMPVDSTQTEPPFIIGNKVLLKISKGFILRYDNKEHEVFKVQSVYEIPVNDVRTREDIYEFYKDATLSLKEAYQFVQKQVPLLPSQTFHTKPIEAYEREIGGVLFLLNSRN